MWIICNFNLISLRLILYRWDIWIRDKTSIFTEIIYIKKFNVYRLL